MVRRGSTVRVRQRAFGKWLQTGELPSADAGKSILSGSGDRSWGKLHPPAATQSVQRPQEVADAFTSATSSSPLSTKRVLAYAFRSSTAVRVRMETSDQTSLPGQPVRSEPRQVIHELRCWLIGRPTIAPPRRASRLLPTVDHRRRSRRRRTLSPWPHMSSASQIVAVGGPDSPRCLIGEHALVGERLEEPADPEPARVPRRPPGREDVIRPDRLVRVRDRGPLADEE